jgi:hypothetical protein
MTNPNRQDKLDKIYLFGPPRQFAKVLIALGLFFALLPLVPRDYGMASNNKDREQPKNIIGTGRER